MNKPLHSKVSFKARLQRDVKALFKEIDRVNEDDDDRYGDKDLPGVGNDDPVSSEKLQEYRRKARELLLSPEGLARRSRRPIEPEAVFGQIKSNRQFRRFLLKGLPKVNIEFGLMAIAHNLMKIWQGMQDFMVPAGLYRSNKLQMAC